MVLKQVYREINEDTTAKVEFFMFLVITISVSEAIVESWGSFIDAVTRSKVAFKGFG